MLTLRLLDHRSSLIHYFGSFVSCTCVRNNDEVGPAWYDALHTQWTITSGCQADKDARSRMLLKMKPRISVFLQREMSLKLWLTSGDGSCCQPQASRRPCHPDAPCKTSALQNAALLFTLTAFNADPDVEQQTKWKDNTTRAKWLTRRLPVHRLSCSAKNCQKSRFKVSAPAPTRAPSRCLACRASEHSGLQEVGRMGEEEEGEEQWTRSSLTLKTLFFAGALNCQFMGKSEQSISGVRQREHNYPAPSHLDQIVSFNPRHSCLVEVGGVGRGRLMIL